MEISFSVVETYFFLFHFLVGVLNLLSYFLGSSSESFSKLLR